MDTPILIKPIPAQVINERASYGPFNLADYIQTQDGSVITFNAQLKSGESLPKGLICTGDGVLTGIPGQKTQGNYEVVIIAKNDAGQLEAEFVLTIKPNLSEEGENYLHQLKKQVWEAIKTDISIPDMGFDINQPITIFEIYYLLERWAVLKAWDAFNLDPAGEKVLLNLEDVSPHYNVYDRGSCIVAVPKDLFSHERTIADGLQTARAVAREVYKRGWTVELVGFEKLTRAAWVEIQQLGDKYGKHIEVINFQPTINDVRIYNTQTYEGPS
jgi:Putative Ig domain